jgi:transposase
MIKLKKKQCTCPICKSSSINIKGYRNRIINHTILSEIKCVLIYRVRRYVCKSCLKTFDEKNPFVLKNRRLSIYSDVQILNDLKDPHQTFNVIAKRHFTSSTNVMTLFDRHIQMDRKPMPLVVCIDEFHLGKHGVAGRYVCVFLDFLKNEIIDVLPSRKKYYLQHYFQSVPQKELDRLRFVSIDMWVPYRDIAKLTFKNVIVCVDSFHVVWNINNALRRVRIRIMNSYERDSREYYLLKKFNFLLMKNGDDVVYSPAKFNHRLDRYINYPGLLKLILEIDHDLLVAYELKEIYIKFNKRSSLQTAETQLHTILDLFKRANIVEYHEITKMLKKWKKEIVNSFHMIDGRRISNGIIESKNARIKVILKNANGYMNFDRLRARIMYCLNKDSAPSLNDSFSSKKYDFGKRK